MRFPYSNLMLWLGSLTPVVTAQPPNEREVASPSATIDSGPLRGKVTQLPTSKTTVNQFLGIPYAKPPVGELRFRAPQSPETWRKPYDATEQPNACMQWFGPNGTSRDVQLALFNNPPARNESEDCLYTNVYAPSGGAKDKPVLFWIHGGSGTFGSAALPLYDGTGFAANHDIVVVAANYRLNIFGYPTTSLLPLTERNLGLLDSRLALDWTRRNIRAFGGDPDKITIMGESAGAMAVSEFINTFPTDPPFRAGIMGSGSALVFPDFGGLTPEALWDKLLPHLNCTDTKSDTGKLSCVKDTPAELLSQVTNAQNLKFTKWYEDNVTRPSDVGARWAAGNVAKVPIMIGSTANELSFATIGMGDDAGESIAAMVGNDTALSKTVHDMYDLGANAGKEAINQVVTDGWFGCTSGFVANMTSTRLGARVWQYLFDAQVPSITWDQWPFLGKYHSSEIGMQFGTYPRENSTQVDVEMSNIMQKQIADFVKDPEAGPGWDEWPQVGILGLKGETPNVRTEHVGKLNPICALWDLKYQDMVPELFSSANNASSRGNGTAGNSAVGGPGGDYESSASQDFIPLLATIIGAGVIGYAALI